jgi:hypothetical protein
MRASTTLRSTSVSIAFLASAGLLALGVCCPTHKRVASEAPRFGLESEVLCAEGSDAPLVLKLFGEDAAALFATNRGAFRDLIEIGKLDNPSRELSVGPWREAVLQWARSRRLSPYLHHLQILGPDQWERLRMIPGCLPLLGRGARDAEAMLAEHGIRAWKLFLVVDFANDVEGVEGVARALAVHGDRMLEVNDTHGPALALFFVPPSKDTSGLLPQLFGDAVERLGIDRAGALFLGNYDDIERLVLQEGRSREDLIGVFDLLAGQPESVREMAADSSLVVRLLLERRRREPIGAVILSRCGPEAANLLFEKGGYASDKTEKDAALSILSHFGWPGVELLRAFRDDDSWHRFLRHADLMDTDDEPLIVRLAGKLALDPGREDAIRRYLEMPRAQIVEEEIPPTLASRALEWIPGYVAVHTAYEVARGYRVENSEAGLALVDGLLTVTFLGRLAGQAIKTVGRQVAKAEGEAAIRSVEVRATHQLTAKEGGRAARTIMTHLPGALTAFTRSLPTRLPTLDVTSVIRSASGVAKKVGVRTWGKLDRRIIMRGDRRVVVNFFHTDVVSKAGNRLRDDVSGALRDRFFRAIDWKTASGEVGELSPCILERVLPGLSIQAEEWPLERRPDPELPPRDSWRDLTSGLRSHAVFRGVAAVSFVACLVLAIPGVRRAVGRVRRSRSSASGTPTNQRPRPYRE